MAKSKYKRILLKLSGESLCEPGASGISGERLGAIAKRVADISELGPQIAIVIGAGNILRGEAFSQSSAIPRHTADYMGMLATIINCCALQETLEKIGKPTRVLSAIEVEAICEPFIKRRAIRHMERGRITILAGGTGNPFFTTDTCAALRASELDANLLIKATKVDGVYDADPVKHPDAKMYDQLTYEDVLQQNLRIMDHAAISLCRENHIPMVVLNIFDQDNLERAICGERVGTLVCAGASTPD